MIDMLGHFLPVLLSGFMVNVRIAFAAVAIGLFLGLPLALLRHSAPWSRWLVNPCVRLMQAAPVYVVMFFVLNALPGDLVLFGAPVTGLAAVILSQALNMIAYVAENGYQAIEYLSRSERDHALLFIPNLLRGFLVVVMSSGIGAAIGVSEAVGVTMRQAEQLHVLGDRVLLFLDVIALFAAIFGVTNALIQRVVRLLSASAPVASQRRDG